MKFRGVADQLRQRSGLWLLLALEATAVAFWLPSILWPFTISWDENTFYLVAQRLLEGELPYTTTFENKSPLGLIFQSMAMAVVGPSMNGMRLVAALLIGLTAFLLVSAAPTRKRGVPAYFVGALFLLSWVNLVNGTVWMSEVNVVLVFAVTWYFIVSHRGNGWIPLVTTGVLIGTLPLMRVNWAFVSVTLLVGLWLWNRSARSLVLLALSALIPSALTVAIYVLSGQLPRLWAGMIQLPSGLGETEGWRFPSLQDDQMPLYWLALIMFVTALQLMALRVQRIRNGSFNAFDVLLLAAAWALSLGAWIQPYDFPYQTLQFLPFVALAVGRQIMVFGKYASAALIPVSLACLSLTYLYVINVVNAFDWRNTSLQETNLVAYLETVPGIADKSIWVPDDNNFVYWRLGKQSIIPLASQPYLVWERGAQRADLGFEMSESEATQYVFDQLPDLIVADSDYAGSFSGSRAASEVWAANLSARYRPLASMDGRTIWELSSK